MGKTGVLFVGILGSVASTAVAGTLAVLKNIVPAKGLITETKRLQGLSLVPLKDIFFGGWDIREDNLYVASLKNDVISKDLLFLLQKELVETKVYPGTKANLDDLTCKTYRVRKNKNSTNLFNEIEKIKGNIEDFITRHQLERIVVINVSSTETPVPKELFKLDLHGFEEAVKNNDSRISSSMLYAYAAISKGCAFINFTPNVCSELPALQDLAHKKGAPLAGKDGKTGQTLYKSVLAGMFKARELKIKGWYSTNILGNNDGKILNNEQHAQMKIETKSQVLKEILGYDDFNHVVRIDYYPPRGDCKEAWDNIDFEGWMGSRMSMKINWLGCDSMLAAPLLLDLARMADYSLKNKEKGDLIHLSMFFKSPYGSLSQIKYDFPSQYLLFEEYIEKNIT